MPYKIKGNAVVKADTGKVVGRSRDPKKYNRTLRAIEHGFKPGKKQGRNNSQRIAREKNHKSGWF